MTEYRSVLERAGSNFAPLDLELESLLRRRDRKRRNQRIAAGVVGIAVFVAAIWVVTSGLSLDRTQTPVAPRPAETGTTQTAPPPAPASATPAIVVRTGTCSGSAQWSLELTDTGDWINVRFVVHQIPAGHEWRIDFRRMPHHFFRTGVFFRGTRVASDSGVLVVEPRHYDWAGKHKVVVEAVDRQTGQLCKARAWYRD